MSVIFRFVGDPAGYIVADDKDRPMQGWVAATVGGKVVAINIDQAYLMETEHSEPKP